MEWIKAMGSRELWTLSSLNGIFFLFFFFSFSAIRFSSYYVNVYRTICFFCFAQLRLTWWWWWIIDGGFYSISCRFLLFRRLPRAVGNLSADIVTSNRDNDVPISNYEFSIFNGAAVERTNDRRSQRKCQFSCPAISLTSAWKSRKCYKIFSVLFAAT